jgi:hypothetical protein
MPPCVICLKRPRIGSLLCDVCGRSYDRDLRIGDGTIAGAIRWAARRARFFERRRASFILREGGKRDQV